MKIQQLLDDVNLTHFLKSRNLSPEFIARRIKQSRSIANVFQKQNVGDDTDIRAFFVPGRIEVLGKHTDYAGGKSLTCAIDRGFFIAAKPRSDSRIALTIAPNANSSTPLSHLEQAEFEISDALSPTVGHWSNYPMTTARRMAMNFNPQHFEGGKWRGADIVFASDLPPAAGLSSSSALIIAIYKIIAAFNRLETHPAYQKNITSPESLAEYLGAVENGRNYRELMGTAGVGTLGGSEDHVAILCSEPGVLKCFSYAPTQFLRKVALPPGWCLAVGSSGAKAEKTGAAMQRYNRLSRLTAEVTAAWRKATDSDAVNLAAMMQSPLYSTEKLSSILREGHSAEATTEYLRRVEHFVIEDQQYVPAALDALASDDIEGFARVVNQSHDLGDQLLENQIAETRALVRIAREVGALGASAFGAGFGGSVYAVIQLDRAYEFCKTWHEHYRREFPVQAAEAEFFVTLPSCATLEMN